MISLPYKIGAALLLALALLGSGYYLGKGHVQTQTIFQDRVIEKRVEVQVKGETQIQFRDRIVTVTRTVKPDGTVQEQTRTEEKAKDTSQLVTQQETTHELEHVVAVEKIQIPVPQAEYSLGLRYRGPALNGQGLAGYRPDYRSLEITAARRILGPIFLDAGLSGRMEVSLGIRIDL